MTRMRVIRRWGDREGITPMCNKSFATATRVALAAISLATLPGSAIAADLGARAPGPYQPPPAPPPVFSWTGCYVGANIGGGWASNSSNDVAGAVTGVAGADLGSHTAGGFIGGGQIGCDYQAGVWVLGLQGMFDGSGMEGATPIPLACSQLIPRSPGWLR